LSEYRDGTGDLAPGGTPESRIHSGRAHSFLDAVARASERWLQERLSGATTPQLAPRLIQRIVEVTLADFVEQCSLRHERGLQPFPADMSISVGGLTLDGRTGKVGIAPLLLLKAVGAFFLHSAHVMEAFMRGILRTRDSARGDATLVFGVGAEDLQAGGDDARFLEYCRGGPIDPLRRARRLVIQSVSPIVSSRQADVEYHRFPLQALVAGNRVSAGGLIEFLRAWVASAARYMYAVIRCPASALLGRDFAYQPMAEWLNRRTLIESVVFTSSNYTAQPLWMRHFPGRTYRTHMVWYSQNTLPFVYVFDPVAVPLPVHRHLSFDETWVWTEGFAGFLRSLGIGARINVIGPILFYLPGKVIQRRAAGRPRIAVFDVMTMVPSLARKIWLRYNYYSVEHTTRFLGDIVAARDAIRSESGKAATIVLKHKRPQASIHEPRYLDYVGRLSRSAVDFEMVPESSDLYGLIAGCDFIVVVPWSSPAYVAQSIGVPAIYYDPSGELLPTFDQLPGIEFASGPEALMAAMRRLLASVPASPKPS
jgi:hypothetical protein